MHLKGSKQNRGAVWKSCVSLNSCRVWGEKISRNIFYLFSGESFHGCPFNLMKRWIGICGSVYRLATVTLSLDSCQLSLWICDWLWFLKLRRKFVPCHANSGHLMSVGDKKPRLLSKLLKLEADLVSDLYSTKSLGLFLMEGGKNVAIRFLQWADILTFLR